ncbi:MAG: helix-turn-helix transcriptional regulator [Caulobacteraceae bacterium]
MPKSVFGGAHQDLVRVLTEARKSSGLLQAQLGEKVGKDQTFISLIENSQRRVDVLEFIALCRAMKIDPAKIFAILLERMPDTFDI